MMRPSKGPGEAEDIAVVGLACLYPGAPSVGAFWRNIVSKVDAITDPPLEAWDSALYYEAGTEENDRVYCRKGGYLGPIAHFDPLEHGIMPRAVEGGEPDQWLALHVAREALRDAGCSDASGYRDRAALILGKGTYANRGTLSVVQHALIVDYTLGLLRSLHPELTDGDLRLIRTDLKRRLPRFDSETAPALIPNVTAGRIANRLDIMGPSYTVDAACASSLVAIDIAAKGLRHGEYDLALVGGMQVATPLPVLSLFCQLKALSASERIRPFDKDADGTLLSEGVAMAVLKRRSQAEADGDRIYAFVRGTGVASDGRAVGILAPRVEGEELALRRAYGSAGIPPLSVGLLEAHGTGTLVGDAVEVEALTRVFGERVQPPRCALGSVKSMIGHTMPAAGMAGFIKAVLALYHKVLPPTLNVDSPSPRLGLDRSPFYINTETRPWIHGDETQPRRAGINSFGFGGINAHIVVEEAPAAAVAETLDIEWDSEVLILSGSNRDELIGLCRRIASLVSRDPAPALADVAFSLNTHQVSQRPAGATLGIVARSTEDLSRKLERAMTRLADPACRKIKDAGGVYYFDEPLARQGKVAFVFPGEGAQYVNMLSDLCRHFPDVRQCFDDMDRVLYDHPRGYRLSDVVFPPPAFSDESRAEAERRLLQMDLAVEAVAVANNAMFGLLTRFGITPDAMLGHSSGEYSAMRAAGMFDEANYDRRVVELNDQQYGRIAESREIPSDARLFAVGGAREQVEALCASAGARVHIAMDNCRHQVVIISDAASAALLEPRLRDAGLLYERLAFDRPYHTPDFEPFAATLKPTLAQWIVRAATVPLYSCTSAAVYPSELSAAHQLAYEHWIRPVEFRRTIENMWHDGYRVFVESGPRGNLTAFIEDILGGRPFAAVASNVSRRSGTLQLHHFLAQVAAHGVSVTLQPLYERRRLARVDWDAPPAAPRRSLGRVKLPTGAPEMRLSRETLAAIRDRIGAVTQPVASSRTAPVAAPRVETQPVADPLPAAAPAVETVAVGAGAPRVMSAFMQTMNTFLAVEQDMIENRFAGAHAGTAVIAAAPALPLVKPVAGGAGVLIAHATLDPERHPFLRDHTLGRNVSADSGLTGFPIVPFTALMEMMAETASALVPGAKVIGMREVRVHRWLAVDRGPLQLELTAESRGADRVSVKVADTGAPDAGTVAEGIMLLGATYPAPPAAAALTLQSERAYKWAPDQLYGEAMFHGPMFRGVRSVDRVGDNGAEATLVALRPDGLVAPNPEDGFATDFVLLDQPGQVVGFWTSHYLERGFVVLPFRMGALDLYGPIPRPDRQFSCRAKIELIGEQQVRSDLDVIDDTGRLWARFEQWEDRRFDLPHAAFRALLQPLSARLSSEWSVVNESAAGAGRVMAFRLGPSAFPRGWLFAHGGMWARVLASLMLGRREREHWHALKMTENRRLEWLLGRIAAKDAVRDFLQRRFRMAVRPADVEILPDASGCPRVSGAWTSSVPRVPLVSISHVDGEAVAALTDGDGIVGVGIDLERFGRMKSGMERVAFRPQELELLQGLEGDERQNWTLRLWCAKEAAAKAVALAAGPVSESIAIQAIDRSAGTVLVRYTTPAGGDRDLSASTIRDGDWIAATCVR